MKNQLVLKQGNVHNVTLGTVEVADIFVKDGKIEKIAEILEPVEINEAEILDASGLEIYPGFVDAHCHLGLEGYAVGFESDDVNEINDSITPELHAIDAINPMDASLNWQEKQVSLQWLPVRVVPMWLEELSPS